MLRQPVRGLKFQRFEVSENSSWIKFHGPEIFLVDRFEMDEKCRKCRKNTFPRSDRYGWVMMFIDLVPIWKQFRTIFETSVLILEKHTPDKIHESETGRPFFSYPIIGMFFISNYRDANACNKYKNVNDVSYICISDSWIYWQIESNIFIYIYIYLLLFFWLLCGSDWRNKSGFASTDAKGWNPRVQGCFSQCSGRLQAVIAVRSQYKDCMKTKDAEAFGFADLFGLIRRVHIRIIQNIFSCHIT